MNEKEIIKELRSTFKELFKDDKDARIFFAPGRVNLIGEHTDYNGGHVFPCALTIGTYAMARKRDDHKFNFYSLNFPKREIVTSSLEEMTGYDKTKSWTNYPAGVVWTFLQKGHQIPNGLDIVVCGNIPVSSGLSSSASLEVLMGYILKEIFSIPVTNQDLALYGQYAENKYIGVNCGIMDQFVIAMGKEDHAIFLDTSSLKFEYVPVILKDESLVIVNTNRPRGLHDSKYNERRSECESALAELQQVVKIDSLGDLDEESFAKYGKAITNEVNYRRARHAVTENQRTIKAVTALRNNDLITFGQLMNESHDSLDKDYEVTGGELDALVNAARKVKGVIGSRMTGAGFGGCTVNLVKKDALKNFEAEVETEYEKQIGYKPSFYAVSIGSGPKEF